MKKRTYEQVENDSETVENDSEEEVQQMTKVNKLILEMFWRIIYDDDDIRLNAVARLITILKQHQENHNQDNGNKLCPDLEYCLNRFIKGLGSSGDSARNGYYVALVEILKTFDEISSADVVLLIDKIYKKREEKNMLIGFLLSLCSLVRSGTGKEDSSVIGTILETVIDVAKNKPMLECFSIKILEELLLNVDLKMIRSTVYPQFEDQLTTGLDAATPFSVWLLLKMHRLFPNVVGKKFLNQQWNKCEELDNFTRIVKQSTSAHPTIHPVCFELIDFFSLISKLDSFWMKLESLLFNDQKEKAYLGYELFKILLTRANDVDKLQVILSPNMLISVSANIHNNSLILFPVASTVITKLADFVQASSDPNQQFLVLESLLAINGKVRPEDLTTDKELKQLSGRLWTEMKPEAIAMYAEFLLQVFKGNNERLKDMQTRLHAASKLTNVLYHPSLKGKSELLIESMKLLLLHAHFNVDVELSEDDPTKDDEERFVSTSHLFCGKVLDLLGTSVQGRDYCDHLYEIAQYLSTLLHSPRHSLKKLSPDIIPLFERILKTVNRLRKPKYADRPESEVFQALFLHLALKLAFNDTFPFIEELEICCKKALKSTKSADEDEPTWVEVLVDMFLDISAQPGLLLRNIIKRTFKLLKPFVTVKIVKQICDVIVGDSDVLEVNEDESDEESDDKAEFDDEEEVDSDDDDDEVEEEYIEKTKQQDKLRADVRAALGGDGDASDIDLDDADEEELTKLDLALSSAFKQNKRANGASLEHFKCRCLDLFQILVDGGVVVQHLWTMLAPLLKAYRREILNANKPKRKKGNEAVKVKNNVGGLRAKILHLLTSLKKTEMIQNDEAIDWENIWTEVVFDGRNKSIPELKLPTLINSMVNGTINATSSTGKVIKKEDIFDTYRKCLRQSLNNKHTFKMDVVVELLHSSPEFANSVIDDFIDFGTTGKTKFGKVEALSILDQHILKQPEVVKDWTKDQWLTFIGKMGTFAETLVVNKSVPLFGSICDVCRMLVGATRQYKRFNENDDDNGQAVYRSLNQFFDKIVKSGTTSIKLIACAEQARLNMKNAFNCPYVPMKKYRKKNNKKAADASNKQITNQVHAKQNNVMNKKPKLDVLNGDVSEQNESSEQNVTNQGNVSLAKKTKKLLKSGKRKEASVDSKRKSKKFKGIANM